MSRTLDAYRADWQKRVMREVAGRALASYPIPVDRVRLVRYEDNAVYRVEDRDGGRHVLRVSASNGHPRAAQESELGWLERLALHGKLPVPRVVRTVDDHRTIVLEDRYGDAHVCVVFGWIDGQANPRRFDLQAATATGVTTGRLHRHGDPAVGDALERPSWQPHDLVGDWAPWRRVPDLDSGTSRQLDALARRVADDFGHLAPRTRTAQLVHADLHRGNIVLRGDEVALIDFDDCGLGQTMLDVASMLSSIYRTCADEGSYQRLAGAFLDGYESVHPLPADFAAALPTFLVLRDMVIVNFVLTSDNEAVQVWGPGRVAGILDHLEYHLRSGRYPGDQL